MATNCLVVIAVDYSGSVADAGTLNKAIAQIDAALRVRTFSLG